MTITGTSPCDNQPCQNGGKCTDLSTTEYRCDCTEQWQGDICNMGKCKNIHHALWVSAKTYSLVMLVSIKIYFVPCGYL